LEKKTNHVCGAEPRPTPQRDDATLLRAWAEGDNKAGQSLFERHAPTLRRFLRSKVTDAVEDVLHDSFLGLRSAATRSDIEDVRAFLFGVARNHVLMHYRRKRREIAEPLGDHPIASLQPRPSEVLVSKRESRRLLRALREIPLDDQIALELHYWARLTTARAADVLEIPAGTFKWRLSRARDRLRAKLSELEADPAAVATTMDDLEHWAQRVHEQEVR
jgi:RNA polymerase sigma-70 factor (ECF subfamily)